MSAPISNVRPKPDKVLVDIADYVDAATRSTRQGGLRHRALLPDRHAGLRLRGAVLSGVHQAAGPDRAGHHRAQRRQGAGHAVPARSGAGGVQYRRDDPLARLQRHLARRGMGPSVRQSRRHSRHRRLAVAQRGRRGQDAADDAGRADRDDQGARDPGRDRAGEQLQPRRPRSRRAGQGRVDRGRRGRCSASRATKSSTRCRWPGSTARACAPIATRPIPARARAGRPATRRRGRCASR